MSDFRLKVFQCVARHLSFTKAAQELHLSQPAVTKHIQELENYYQNGLFLRQGNKIALTKAGMLLLKHSEIILNDYRQLKYEMDLLCGNFSGELKLGASTTIEQYVIPEILGQFMSQYPQVKISMLNGNSRAIETALQNNDIELGIVEGLTRLPQLKYTKFIDDELVAVVHTRRKLAELPDEISIEELRAIPLALREQGSGTLEVIEECLQQHHLKLSQFNVIIHLGSTESIKHFCATNDCMGIVSVRSITNELHDGTLRIIDIKGLTMLREFCFMQRQGHNDNLEQLFLKYALNYRTI